MIKRPSSGHFPEFAPLITEHTSGLQFVQQLRLSIRRGIAQGRIKEYCIWYWQHHIKPHFYQEEKILMPFLDPQDEYVLAVLEDHRQIRDLIVSLTGMVSEMHLLHLANLLEANIRFEEGRFFPDAYERISAPLLAEISLKFQQHAVDPGIWEDEFWYE